VNDDARDSWPTFTEMAFAAAVVVALVAVAVLSVCGCQTQERVPVYYPALVVPTGCGDCGACHEVNYAGNRVLLHYGMGGMDMKRRDRV
jgi:hypothetical protein